MSTSYQLLKDERIKLEIFEASNLLEFGISTNDDRPPISSEEMEPEKMLHTLLKGVVSVSYWMEEEKFREIVSGYTASILELEN